MAASGGKWSGEGAHPYLGFGGHGETMARSHDSGFLLGSMTCSEDDVPVILWSRRGTGRHQGASAVLLGPVVELGWVRIHLVTATGFKTDGGSV
jgi:hypothetical protein